MAIDYDMAERVVNFMNELLRIDRNAITNLISHRVPCNCTLADHPTVQVDGREGCKVGMLGVLNGLCGIDEDGYGGVIAEWEGDPPSINRFKAVRIFKMSYPYDAI